MNQIEGACNQHPDGCPDGSHLPSNERASWYIVLYEWQGAHDLTDCRAWYPSAEIFMSDESARSAIERYSKGREPRPGKQTYRNIRGPFPWQESPVETSERLAKDMRCKHARLLTEPCAYCEQGSEEGGERVVLLGPDGVLRARTLTQETSDQRVANLLRALDAKQAKIDALMLEFCPGEMTAEQKANWAAHQQQESNPRAVEGDRSCAVGGAVLPGQPVFVDAARGSGLSEKASVLPHNNTCMCAACQQKRGTVNGLANGTISNKRGESK